MPWFGLPVTPTTNAPAAIAQGDPNKVARRRTAAATLRSNMTPFLVGYLVSPTISAIQALVRLDPRGLGQRGVVHDLAPDAGVEFFGRQDQRFGTGLGELVLNGRHAQRLDRFGVELFDDGARRLG